MRKAFALFFVLMCLVFCSSAHIRFHLTKADTIPKKDKMNKFSKSAEIHGGILIDNKRGMNIGIDYFLKYNFFCFGVGYDFAGKEYKKFSSVNIREYLQYANLLHIGAEVLIPYKKTVSFFTAGVCWGRGRTGEELSDGSVVYYVSSLLGFRLSGNIRYEISDKIHAGAGIDYIEVNRFEYIPAAKFISPGLVVSYKFGKQ